MAESVHGFIEAAIEIHKGVGDPDLFLKLGARDDLTGTFKQCRQDLKRLLLEPDLHSRSAEFSSLNVGLEDSETYCRQ
jgi:hypothetical protein